MWSLSTEISGITRPSSSPTTISIIITTLSCFPMTTSPSSRHLCALLCNCTSIVEPIEIEWNSSVWAGLGDCRKSTYLTWDGASQLDRCHFQPYSIIVVWDTYRSDTIVSHPANWCNEHVSCCVSSWYRRGRLVIIYGRVSTTNKHPLPSPDIPNIIYLQSYEIYKVLSVRLRGNIFR